MSVPSAFQLEQAMSALMSARARLLAEDPDLAGDEAALAALLGAETDDAMEMVHRLLRAAVHAADMARAASERARTISERAARYDRRHEALRAAAFAAMDALEMRKIELPDLTATVRAGTARAVITDESVIPAEYTRTKIEPNKSAILADLKVGVVIPGAELSNGLPSLAIRTA